MQLNGLDALNDLGDLGFDFSALISAAGSAIQASAPKLIEAAVAKKLAKLQSQAKPAAVAAPAPVPVITPALAPVNHGNAAKPSGGVDKKYLIGGGLLLGGALLYALTR